MKRVAHALIVGLVLATACGSTQSTGTAAPGSGTAEWSSAWSTVTEGRAPTADAGDYVLEKAPDGTIVAHRRTQPVSGGGGPLGKIDDSVLEARVYGVIMADSTLRSKSIGVAAKNGVITLT